VATRTEHLDSLELVTLAEISRLAKRGKSSLYRDIAAGRLQVVKIGSSVRVQRPELERYLRGRSA